MEDVIIPPEIIDSQAENDNRDDVFEEEARNNQDTFSNSETAGVHHNSNRSNGSDPEVR